MATRTKRLLDRKYIDVNDPQGLLEQAQYMGVSPQEVAKAVAEVGPDLDAVAAFLRV